MPWTNGAMIDLPRTPQKLGTNGGVPGADEAMIERDTVSSRSGKGSGSQNASSRIALLERQLT